MNWRASDGDVKFNPHVSLVFESFQTTKHSDACFTRVPGWWISASRIFSMCELYAVIRNSRSGCSRIHLMLTGTRSCETCCQQMDPFSEVETWNTSAHNLPSRCVDSCDWLDLEVGAFSPDLTPDFLSLVSGEQEQLNWFPIDFQDNWWKHSSYMYVFVSLCVYLALILVLLKKKTIEDRDWWYKRNFLLLSFSWQTCCLMMICLLLFFFFVQNFVSRFNPLCVHSSVLSNVCVCMWAKNRKKREEGEKREMSCSDLLLVFASAQWFVHWMLSPSFLLLLTDCWYSQWVANKRTGVISVSRAERWC